MDFKKGLEAEIFQFRQETIVGLRDDQILNTFLTLSVGIEPSTAIL